MSKLEPITVRLPADLHRQLRDLAMVRKEPIRIFVIRALRAETELTLEEGGVRLRRALDAMDDYRSACDEEAAAG